MSQNLTKDQKAANTHHQTLLRMSVEAREKAFNVSKILKTNSDPFDMAFSKLVNDPLQPDNQLGSDIKGQTVDLVIVSSIKGSEEYQENFVTLDNLTASDKNHHRDAA
jgi:hypothetical protein